MLSRICGTGQNKFKFKLNKKYFIQYCWGRERRPFVISASGSLDLVDLHGFGAWLVPSGTSQGAKVAPATTQFHWQDPSLSTESSRGEKPSACFSVLGVAGSSLCGTSYPNTCLRSPKVSALARSIAPPWAQKKRGKTSRPASSKCVSS